eukprot:comp4688_c0_seq1/m.3492 comp4688_c0_seq1/g.3492  ORF comp4688_c0_seq1/g.3492 comp4688_c0_seq1/m.3492 type:complete len:101 (+) comp4688_c0_seq1:277-579(+)
MTKFASSWSEAASTSIPVIPFTIGHINLTFSFAIFIFSATSSPPLLFSFAFPIINPFSIINLVLSTTCLTNITDLSLTSSSFNRSTCVTINTTDAPGVLD